jgi:hypothetical protein
MILLGAVGCMKAERTVAVQMAVQTDGGGDAVPIWRPFSAPTLVTGLASDTTDVHGSSLTGDETEIYFSCVLQGEGYYHIWTSTRAARNAPWNTATMVAELYSAYNEQDPDVSPDGKTIYFASDRLGAGYQLYVSQRTARGQTWGPPSPPKPGPELVSSSLDFREPSVDPSGLFMTFCAASRGSENFSLYSASRTDTDPLGAWGNVQQLSGINSDRADADPALFHDSLSLIWSSRAPSNGRSWDLVEVSRPDPVTPFSAVSTTLGSLNTNLSDRHAWVSQDGSHILFSREAVGAPGVLYEAWR